VVAQQYYTAILQRLQHLDMDRWFIALVLIDEAGGSMSQQQLADALRQDKVTMVRAIDHLSAKGYVERRPCPGDRRKYQLCTLPKARAAVKEIRKVYDQVNELAFGGMTASDKKKFMGQLGMVIQNFSHLDNKKVNIRYSKKLPR
jgi:MarR family transcriptional regulator, transcriptional regulator for hemolysin